MAAYACTLLEHILAKILNELQRALLLGQEYNSTLVHMTERSLRQVIGNVGSKFDQNYFHLIATPRITPA